jgi:hypothetical protein
MSLTNLSPSGDMELRPSEIDGLLTNQEELHFVTEMLRPVIGVIFYNGDTEIGILLEKIAEDSVRLFRMSEARKKMKI